MTRTSNARKARTVGINHVALEVDDIDAALEFYGGIFEITLRGRTQHMAFIDMGDQFIALNDERTQAPDTERHFGLVVDDKEAVRRALEDMNVDILPGGGLDFRDFAAGADGLWAVSGADGGGRAPPELLAEPWTQPPNWPQKFMHPVEATAWEAAQMGQADAETLDALIGRLGAAGDPDWLDGDLVGALSALTGERFGYDRDAWRDWLARRQR